MAAVQKKCRRALFESVFLLPSRFSSLGRRAVPRATTATEQARSQLHFAPGDIKIRSLTVENEAFEVAWLVSKAHPVSPGLAASRRSAGAGKAGKPYNSGFKNVQEKQAPARVAELRSAPGFK